MKTFTKNICHVSCFTNASCSGSLARIEKLLEQLTFEHQAGLREQSVISARSIEAAQEGDDGVWHQIGRELEDVGITQCMIGEHKDFIINWINNALQSDRFDETSPESISSAVSDLSKEGSDVHLSGLHIDVSDQIGGAGVDYGGEIGNADSVMKRWTEVASASELGNLDNMQRRDLLPVHIWEHYNKTKEQLPNQDRLRNLTWRMMAKNSKPKEEEQLR